MYVHVSACTYVHVSAYTHWNRPENNITSVDAEASLGASHRELAAVVIP